MLYDRDCSRVRSAITPLGKIDPSLECISFHDSGFTSNYNLLEAVMTGYGATTKEECLAGAIIAAEYLLEKDRLYPERRDAYVVSDENGEVILSLSLLDNQQQVLADQLRLLRSQQQALNC